MTRSIPLPDGMDRSRITTAVTLKDDGEIAQARMLRFAELIE